MGIHRYGISGRESTAHCKNWSFKFSYTDHLHKCTGFYGDGDFETKVQNRSERLFNKRANKPIISSNGYELGRIPFVVEYKPDKDYPSVVWRNWGALFHIESLTEDPAGIENGDYGFPCGYIKAEGGKWRFYDDRTAFDKWGRFKEGTYDDGGNK